MFSRYARELDRFDNMLRESDSATATLIEWISISTPESDVVLHAVTLPCATPPSPVGLLTRLDAPANDISYRHVRLVHKGRIVSDAHNWYVPSRLTPSMVQALATTTTPFGTLIEPLCPTRETLASEKLWSPDDPSQTLPPRLLHHQALLRSGSGIPICEVSEVYTRNILRFIAP